MSETPKRTSLSQCGKTLAVLALLQWEVADALVDRAIAIEAEARQRPRETQGFKIAMKRAMDLRALAAALYAAKLPKFRQ